MDVVSRGGAVRRRVQENNETRFTDRYLSESFEFILYPKSKGRAGLSENVYQFQPANGYVVGCAPLCGCVCQALKHHSDDNKSHAEYALHLDSFFSFYSYPNIRISRSMIFDAYHLEWLMPGW